MIKKIKNIKDFSQAFFYIKKYFKNFTIITIYPTFSNLVVLFRGEDNNLYIFKLFKNHFLYYDNASFKNAYSIYGKHNLTNKEIVIKDYYVILQFLPDQKNKDNWLNPLAQSFATLHQISIQNIKQQINIKNLVQYYESLIKVLSPDLIQKKMQILSNLEKRPKLLVYSHNDFSPDNFVIYNNKAYFIDIEYSGINDIFFELANIKLNLQDKFNEFLAIYLSKNLNYKTFIQEHMPDLQQMEYIVLYITFLWFTILGDRGKTQFYKEKLQNYEIL